MKKLFPEGFDFQGHRGCRGLMPENTIPGFLHAIEMGVKTLEMDVVITKDKKVVVSHEPFMSHEITLKPNGEPVTTQEEKELNIFKLSYEEVKLYDVGSKIHPRFQHQVKLKVSKPLLSDVITSAESFMREKRIRLFYNIEIKSTAEGDGIYHPDIKEFTDLLIGVLKENKILPYTTIQCFDVRPLQYMKSMYPELVLSYLVENKNGFDLNLQNLGFIPDVYSPDYELVDKKLVDQCHAHRMKILPWTINDLPTMRDMIALGVDGIISDYPNLYNELK